MKKRVLVVDDEEVMTRLIQKRLELNGYEVLLANDGQTALESARHNKPDLIILDLMLPKLDGYKVCRLLKFDEKYKTIPIIILSALGHENDVNLGNDMGADAYLLKPFDSQELLQKISELLNK